MVNIRERTLGAANPATLASRLNLSLLKLRRGEIDESLRLSQETARRAQATLGTDHLYTFLAEEQMARALQRGGRVLEAEPLIRSVLERARARLGDDHWRVGRMLVTHAACLIDLGHHEDAQRELEEAHANLSGQFGPSDDRTQMAVAELVRLFEATGQSESVAAWSTIRVE